MYVFVKAAFLYIFAELMLPLFTTRPFFRYSTHILLFVLTFVSTTLAGAEWSTNTSLFSVERPLGWNEFLYGLHFSVPFLLVLSTHEFGHYVAARLCRISVSLPYYMPLWLGFLGIPSIGTAGAFIRIRSRMQSRSQYFDIGVAGPLAGFVIAVALLYYGFITLPSATHIFSIHPEYEIYGLSYADYVYEKKGSYLIFGEAPLFRLLKASLADPALLPHPYEMIHYPYLLAGYLSLFFTALNLLPIGQLDGGHILYGLVGSRYHRLISRVFLLALLFYAGLGLMRPYLGLTTFLIAAPLYVGFLYLCLRTFSTSKQLRWIVALILFVLQLLLGLFLSEIEGYSGWLLFGFLVGNVLGVDHPVAVNDMRLSRGRQWIAYLSIAVFLLCFAQQPFLFA